MEQRPFKTLYIERNLYNKIERIAKTNNKSMTDQVEYMLNWCINEAEAWSKEMHSLMGRHPAAPHRRRFPVSCRVPHQTLEAIDALIEQGEYRNTSEVLEAALDIFFKVRSHRTMMEDPAKAEEFRLKMQSVIEQEKYSEWLDTMTPDQMTGLIGMLEMAREGRWETQKLR